MVKPELRKQVSMHLDASVDPKLRAMYVEDKALFPFSMEDGFHVNWELFTKLGFTAVDNRVCVALSRARLGFYCT